MKIEFHNRLGSPQRVNVTRVVVYDRFDNPIVLAVEVDEDTIIAATAENSEFNDLLTNLGINKTVIVHATQQVPLPEIRFPQDGR